jgi:Asp-tRNA(Asn)/Glu-tRNA(Gln) amidotransferase A subunit family amidase
MTAFEMQLARLEAAGYTIRRVNALDDIAALMAQHNRLMSAEMAQTHRDWFAQYENLYRPRTAAFIRQGQEVTVSEWAQARERQQTLRDELEAARQDAGIDLWVAPSAPGVAPKGLDATGSPAMSYPWTFAGLPNVSLPAGFNTDGLPLGLQCAAGWMQDEVLLAWARGIAAALARGSAS